MGENLKRIEVNDPETGEVFGLNAGMLVSDLRDVFMSKRRQQIMSTTWNNMSEDQQRDEITAMTEFASEIVTKVVDLVAAAGREVIHAKLDNFKIKAGEVTMTAKGLADDGALLALNHVGNKALKIVVADAEQFDQQREKMEPEPDQPEMFSEPGQPDDDEMSDEEIEDAASEMDAGMQQVEDADNDDLHAEPVDDAPPAVLGQRARLGGNGSDENPFDGGTDEHGEWASGWNAADAEIKAVIETGRQAGLQGEPKKSCPYQPDTDGGQLWLDGWKAGRKEVRAAREEQEAEQVETAETVEAAEPSEPEEQQEPTDGSFEAGFQAAERGEGRDVNPFEDGTVKHRLWNDGWDAAG